MSNLIKPYHGSRSILPLLEDAERIGANQSFFRKCNLVKKLSEFKKKKEIKWIDIPSFLTDFRKKDHGEADFSGYSISQHFSRHRRYYYEGKETLFYADSNYQFVLRNKGNPLSVLGFESQLGAVLIVQIQGKKGKHDELKPLKWPNALVTLMVKWAEQAEINEVQILPHTRNKWNQVKDNESNVKMYYDVTAKREGFKYDSESDLYRKVLIVY